MTALKASRRENACHLPERPPPFGHALLEYFQFEPGFVNLNVGSEGALPLFVQQACDALARQSEASPDKWKRFIVPRLTDAVRQRIAPMIGAEPEELVFVTTTSHAIDTVLHNFEWNEDDVMVHLSTTWKGVKGDVNYIHDTYPHPKVSVYQVAFPTTTENILKGFQSHLRSIRESQFRTRFITGVSSSPPKVVAVIDAICSKPGIRYPWPEMTRICLQEGVYSFVDAAHCMGQELDINLSEIQPDFWMTSCHKWFYSKRGCCVLYVPRRNQHIMKTAFPHNSYPSKRTSTLRERLEAASTRDFTSFLSVGAALDFRTWLGGERTINAYCHSLALAGGRYMAHILGTDLMDESGEFTLNMVNVRLPMSVEVVENHETMGFIDSKLLLESNVFGLVFKHNEAWWVRCCAQVWNEVSDFEYFADVLLDLCREVEYRFHSRLMIEE